MKYYTITLRLDGAPSRAVAVEWTNQFASIDGEPEWEPCLRLGDGAWKFSSREPFGASPPHERAPGSFGDLAIRYRLSAAGPWSEASATRKEIVVLDMAEDDAEGRSASGRAGARRRPDPGRVGQDRVRDQRDVGALERASRAEDFLSVASRRRPCSRRRLSSLCARAGGRSGRGRLRRHGAQRCR